MDPRLFKIISYDIVCQWWKQLQERLEKLPPPLVRLKLILNIVRFVVPKMHINGHTRKCQSTFSLNWVPGSGQTDAEGIERAWAMVGGLAASTRVMGPGSRSDTLDDHWSFWNWTKLLGMASTLRRRLDVAAAELAKQQAAFKHFSEEQADSVDEWTDLVEAYEADGTKKNPYESEITGRVIQSRDDRHLLTTQEKRAQPVVHEVGPVAFVALGLAVEEEQRELKIQVVLKKAKSTSGKLSIKRLRRKLARNMQQLRSIQATYTPTALVQLQALSLPSETLAENIPLLLPSTLAVGQPTTTELGELLSIERELRQAQCRSALVALRNQLHIKARLLVYKKNHSRHQTQNTRSRAVVARNESQIRLHSEKYQTAWNVLLLIVGGNESQVGFLRLQKSDIRCMEQPEVYARKQVERERMESRARATRERLIAERELLPEEPRADAVEDVEMADDEEHIVEGQNRSVMSWIWRGTGRTGTDAELVEAIRIEWTKAWARVRRWDEEVRILQEEWRRLPLSLKYQQDRWRSRAAMVPVGIVPAAEAEGMIAYAVKQMALYEGLMVRAEITRTEPKLGRGHRRRWYNAETDFGTELGNGGDGNNAELDDEDDDDEELDSDEEIAIGADLDDE
uniref:Uncharacterized protein n=1 Tax=Mycena chlorophos TaxID=658473 RepID=A0ABQ0KV72_MYCCL|nr:predicted protein [Mycena chlorophos]